jgi:hypothetical protein
MSLAAGQKEAPGKPLATAPGSMEVLGMLYQQRPSTSTHNVQGLRMRLTTLRQLKEEAARRGFVLQRANALVHASYGVDRNRLWLLIKPDRDNAAWLWQECDLHAVPLMIGTRAQITEYLK